MPGGAPQLHGLEWFTGGPVGWYFLGMYVLAVGLALFVLVGVLITVNVMARAPMIANGSAIADVLLSPRDVTADNPLTILR